MKIKWKIVTSLDTLLLAVIILTVIIVNIKITGLVAGKTSDELINYSKLGLSLLDTNYPGDWKLDGNNLYKGDTPMNGNNEVLDKISKETGILTTVFAGDTRIATTVTDDKGSRQVGTKASNAVINTVLISGKEYKGTAKILNKSADTYYVALKDKDGKTVGMWFVGIYSSVIKKQIFNSMSLIIIFLLILAVIGTTVSFFLGTYISKGYQVIRKDLECLENGDFNVTFHDSSLKRKDEVGDIIRSFCNMQDKVRGIISSIKNESENISSSSVILAGGAENVYRDVENISATTEELSAGMEETAASTEEMNATSVSIEEEITRVTNQAKNGQSIAAEIKARAEDLKSTVTDSQSTASAIYDDTNKKLRQAITKAAAINEIKSLSKTILDITAQTNLLALNASIESARAGEAGKGFAVVANEIANLAKNSKNAVSQIEAITNEISLAVEDIITNSKQLLDFMDTKVIKDYEFLVQTGEQYNVDASTVEQMVSDIRDSMTQLNESTIYIRKAIEEVTTASQEGSKGSADIAEKSTSIYHKTNEVLEQANRNKEIAEKLRELTQFFRV